MPPAWCCAAASATPGTETTQTSTVHLSPETRSVTLSEMSISVGEYPLPLASTGKGRGGCSKAPGLPSCCPPAADLPVPPADPTVPCLLPTVGPAAAIKEDEDTHPYIVACLVKTPKMEVSISQTWGWARALANPELEGWTAPYTWLDADVVLLKALAAPVTGILGECGTPACMPASTGLHMPVGCWRQWPTLDDALHGDLPLPVLAADMLPFAFLLSAGDTYPKGEVQEEDLDSMAADILGDSGAHGRSLMARSSLFPMLADLNH